MTRYPIVPVLAFMLLGWLAPIPAHAQFWEEWDLATRPGDVTIYAAAGPGRKFGDVRASSPIPGDVNGDGIDDLAVSQCVILGSPTLAHIYDLKGTVATPPTTRFTIAGDNDNSAYTYLIYGDLNGDGKDEICFARWENVPGRTIVLMGRDNWPATMTLNTSNSLLIREPHYMALSHPSFSRDYNGDGITDFLRDDLMIPGTFQQYFEVLKGTPLWPASGDFDGVNKYDFRVRVTIDNTWTGRGMGRAETARADINRDGFDDFLVNCFQFVSEQPVVAEIKVIAGRSMTVPTLVDAAAPSLVQIQIPLALPPSDGFPHWPGIYVGAVGDWDGDGWINLAVVSTEDVGPDGSRPHAGTIYLFFGPGKKSLPLIMDAADADVIIYGPTADENFGNHVDTADFNGDGIDDLVVNMKRYGANNVPHFTRIIYGRHSWPATMDLAQVPADCTIETPYRSGYFTDNYGGPIPGGFDVNGDGINDYVDGLASPRVVVFGGPDLPAYINVQNGDADIVFQHAESFGFAQGDYNGDGIKDLFIGRSDFQAVPGDPTRGNRGEVIFGRPQPVDVWVDEFTSLPGNGALSHPYRKVIRGLRAVRPGGTVHLTSSGPVATMAEARILKKPMRITKN